MQNHNYFCTANSVGLGLAHSAPLLQWGLRQDGDLEGHLLTICPAGNTCSPVSLWEEEGTAERGDSTCQQGVVSTRLPGSPHIQWYKQDERVPTPPRWLQPSIGGYSGACPSPHPQLRPHGSSVGSE